MSAVRLGSHLVDVNHFEIGVPFEGPSGLPIIDIDLKKEVAFECMYRRSAKAVAGDINGFGRQKQLGSVAFTQWFHTLIGREDRSIGTCLDQPCPTPWSKTLPRLCGKRLFSLVANST